MAGRKRARHRLAGLALFAVIAFIGAGVPLSADASLPAGTAAWLAGLLLWPDTGRRARWQALILIGAGAAAAVTALRLGGSIDPRQAVAANAPLIAMLAAVGFLRLITSPVASEGSAEVRPRGRGAVWRTLAGVHLFGSVVNLSTVFLMAARMTGDQGRLGRDQLRVLTRGFAAAAYWSPFFAAMAAALTFAPGARLPPLLAVGGGCALTALVLTGCSVSREAGGRFVGYPMNWRSLSLPFALAVIILGVHALKPSVSVLGLIALTAPSLALVVMLARRERALSRFRRHVTRRLPGMANELWLFLSAGIIASGLAGLLRALPEWLPFERFAGPQAAATLAVMVTLAMIGVHPVIGIAVVASLLAPLQPDPTLLAMTFLAAWAIGVMASPFGGMNLALQGAYDLGPGDILRANAGHALVMLVVAMAALNGYARFAVAGAGG